jgi:3-oxoacyl-[acyl-carrier protein] reductase
MAIVKNGVSLLHARRQRLNAGTGRFDHEESGLSGKQANRVAVVTGAARGIGRASAMRLARSEFRIAIVDVLEGDAERTAEDVRALGFDAMVVIADVTSLEAAERGVAAIVERFGRIDALVNNAGRTMSKGLLEITEQEWDATIDVNLKSFFCWCRAVAPTMLAQGSGRIVNISSLNAITGGVTRAVSKFAYSAAKAGVLGMTKSLAKELGPGIAVNAVLPGIIRTDINASQVALREAEFVDSILLRRLGSVDDIASIVHYLAAEPHMFMTGQHLVVDGGQWIT